MQMEELDKVIVFRLDKEQYGVNLHKVRFIECLSAVPHSSNFIKGVRK
jgi:chemotaxis signal transduction protein